MRLRALGYAIATALSLLSCALPGCDGSGGARSVASSGPEGIPPEWPRPHFDTAVIRVGGHPITVEIADTFERRQYGFMFVDEVPEDRGMLFIYPKLQPFVSFWMRNTRVPLDLVYFREDGTIINCHREMVPLQDRPGYAASAPCRLVLELPGGWLERHDVWVKDRIDLPPELLQRKAQGDSDPYGDQVRPIPRLLKK